MLGWDGRSGRGTFASVSVSFFPFFLSSAPLLLLLLFYVSWLNWANVAARGLAGGKVGACLSGWGMTAVSERASARTRKLMVLIAL